VGFLGFLGGLFWAGFFNANPVLGDKNEK